MTDDEGAVVIQLRPGQDAKDDDRPLATGPRESFCAHRRTELRTQERRVYCRDCEREVPAFDVLKDLAGHWERFVTGRREAERRLKVTQANLTELLQAERNAKSRRRTWRKHEPEALRHLRAVMDLFPAPRQKVTVTARAFLDDLDGG